MLVLGRVINTITGEEIPAAGFVYNAPSGALGASLEMSLANPLSGSVPIGDAIRAEVGIGTGTPLRFSFVPILAEGLIAGRAARYGWTPGKPVGRPGDTLRASAIDALGDKWQLAPAVPVIMIDPAKVDEGSVEVKAENAVTDYETGGVILPVIEPIENLNLYQVLDRAYTNKTPNLRAGTSSARFLASQGVGTGIGFARVVTNLPNYPIERADFTTGGGWHGGAAGHYAFFEPIAYEDNNSLYIWDVAKSLPAGVVPKSLPMSCYVDLEESNPAETIVNAILLTYLIPTNETSTVDFAGLISNAIPGFRYEHDTPAEGGTPNSPGYYRQEVTRKIQEWKDLTTGAVVFSSEVEVETVNIIYSQRLGAEVVASRETLQVSYQGKLKTGHILTVEATYPNPAIANTPETELAQVYSEECQIEWTADLNNPGESLQKRTQTDTRGVILVEEELDIREGETEPRRTYTPVMEAARGNGIILDPDEAESKGVRQFTTEDRPILTTIEDFQVIGYGQAQTVINRFDHLKGVAYPPVIQSRTGSVSTISGRSAGTVQASTSKTILIKDKDSITKYGLRKALTLNVGWLGKEEGVKLALQTLRRKSKPRRSVSVTLPGLDLSIRRGSILRGATRSGAWVSFIITGYSITASQLGTPAQKIYMTMEGLEVLT